MAKIQSSPLSVEDYENRILYLDSLLAGETDILKVLDITQAMMDCGQAIRELEENQ